MSRLVSISGLTSNDAYGSAEHAARANRSDVAGTPLDAVGVLLWNNRAYPDGGTVYLTNGPVEDPFVVFDDYDWRSVIENGIFKEGKHPWHLEHSPPEDRGRRAAALLPHPDRHDPLHGLPAPAGARRR
ncbi:MAG: hypothetical protein IT307_10060 [Chloroflexi bacterium]|nr:hypothetical protein [Chloroflexota bacterium]